MTAAERAAQAAAGGRAGSVERSTRTIERALATARELLEMEIAYVTEFLGDEQVIRLVDGDTESFGLHPGTRMPLDGSYCKRMIEGQLPTLVADAAADPRVRDLPVTAEAAIGSWVGVPLRAGDGGMYGTVCCASHSPSGSLTERDVRFLHVLARLIADELEQAALERENRRLQLEASGLQALLAAIEARDDYTGHHSRRVVELSGQVARRLGLAEPDVAEIEQIALLHDIGKIGVPDAVLRKHGPLDELEWGIMREHPKIGARIVESIDSLAHLATAIRSEHERWDGTGYPDGLAGEEIPISSRIILVCDAYHAMTSDRPYRRALGPDHALAELRSHAGTQFCPTCVQTLADVLAHSGEIALA